MGRVVGDHRKATGIQTTNISSLNAKHLHRVDTFGLGSETAGLQHVVRQVQGCCRLATLIRCTIRTQQTLRCAHVSHGPWFDVKLRDYQVAQCAVCLRLKAGARASGALQDGAAG